MLFLPPILNDKMRSWRFVHMARRMSRRQRRSRNAVINPGGGPLGPFGELRLAQPRCEKRRLLPPRLEFQPSPELVQALESLFRRIAGNDAGIDRPTRNSNHPVRFDAGLVERLVDPALIGVESAAALEGENDLARQSRRPPSCCGCDAGVMLHVCQFCHPEAARSGRHAHPVTSSYSVGPIASVPLPGTELGTDFSFAEPDKPQGMHWLTYLRMRVAAGESIAI
jgi:hypothetical protein